MERVLEQFTDVRSVPTQTPGAQAWTARELLPDGRERPVLVKRLPGDAPARARATHALALVHPAIVPTRRWLREGDHLFVVRDFAAGQSLRQFTGDAARRAFDRLLSLLSPIVDAVEYAAGAGLPHGGVSQDNVLVRDDGRALLSDFAPVKHGSVAVPTSVLAPRADLWAVCELFKTLLPTRAREDEPGQKARLRLLKNLTDAQDKADTPAALRESLEALGQMADLLGFSSRANGDARTGPRLLWSIYPETVTLPTGGGAGFALRLHNAGDADAPVDAVTCDAVWLNAYERFAPFVLTPASRRDLLWTASAARLAPGRYEPHLLITSGTDEHAVPVPIVVTGEVPSVPEESPPAPNSGGAREQTSLPPRNGSTMQQDVAIAVTQEPDPAITSLGANGVVHLGVQNVGPTRLRLDKITPSPAWLVYPGGFQGLWIEPGRTEYLGFSVVGASLPGGDFKAEVLFGVSVLTETLVGMEPVRREMRCDVRVRVVRGALDAQAAADKAAKSAARGPGCAGPAVLLLAGVAVLVHVLWG